MAKKQFNFAQMAESPIAQDANKTMVAAFEKKPSEVTEESTPSIQQEDMPEPKQAAVASTEKPAGKKKKDPSELDAVELLTMNGKEALRKKFIQYLASSDFTYSKGINVQLPPDICVKMNEIKEELRKTSATNVRMNLKELVQLFVYEGVDRWYTAITGKVE